MEKLDQIIFYSLEKSIKTYRQYAQRQINQQNFDITIDQWLVLKTIQNNPSASQQEIAESAFKDYASITRMIELLVKKEYLSRDFHSTDRRRFELSITEKGIEIINDIMPIVKANRKQALKSFSKEEIESLKISLNKIINNCK